MKEVANMLGGLLYSNLRKPSMIQSVVAFLFGGKDKKGFQLYDLGIDGSVTDIIDYVSDGSGSMFALGVLEAQYKKGLSVNDGVHLAAKAITAALQRDTATGNGLDIWTITSKGVTKVVEKEILLKVDI